MISILSESRGTHRTVLLENTIKLAEGGEATFFTDLLNGFLAVKQFILGVPDPNHL